MEFIYNDEFSNGVVIEDNGDGFAVAIESIVCVCVCVEGIMGSMKGYIMGYMMW